MGVADRAAEHIVKWEPGAAHAAVPSEEAAPQILASTASVR